MIRDMARWPTPLSIRWAVPVAIFLFLAGEAVASGNPVRFREPTVYEIPTSDYGRIVVADLNHDRRSDVVAMSPDTTRPVSVLLAGPGGRLSRSRSLNLRLPDSTTFDGGLEVADLNGDGHRDLVAVVLDHAGDDRGPTVVVALFGNGRGAFSGRTVTRTSCCGGGFSVADFNRDGKADLAIAGASVLLGDGTGRFTRWVSALPEGVATVAIDLNRDRSADLVVLEADEDPDPAGVRIGRGNGQFSPFRALPAGDVGSLAFGRFDRDPWPDLAAVSFLEGDEVLQILRGTSTGRPKPSGTRNVGPYPRNVKAADFNGDRNSDLVVQGFAGRELGRGYLRLLLGTGRGSFGAPTRVSTCCNGRELEVGDFNGDRRPDLLTSFRETVYGNLRIAVLLNATRR